MRSIIHSLAFSMALAADAFEPCRSHHFSIRSTLRKKLCQVNSASSLVKCGAHAGQPEFVQVKTRGTGRHGLAACTMESETTMARVQEDIW